jgi:hypothetical protein
MRCFHKAYGNFGRGVLYRNFVGQGCYRETIYSLLGGRNNGGHTVSEPAIEVGDKLHIITGRRFENDVRRHFVGEVIAISGELHKIQGYAFVFESGVNEYKKRPEQRTRIFSVGQEGFIVSQIPREVAIESLFYRVAGKHLVVTDGGTFTLDINEFGGSR